MSTLSDRLREATRDIVSGERLLPGLFGHSPIEDLEAAADELDRLTARVAEWQRLYRRALNEANGLTNYAEDRPELYSAEKRLARIDHFAREAFEKFASGVECELTNYRWFEAGWDARGDTVAAAPLPSAPDTVQVPREPTPAQCAAGRSEAMFQTDENVTVGGIIHIYRAMIAAAPKSTP